MSTPIKVFYAFTALSYLALLHLASYPLDYLHKALPIFLLAALAMVKLTGFNRLFITAALLLSSVGDILLVSELDNSFIYGLAAFACAHLCYATGFWRWRQWQSWQLWPLGMLLLLTLIMLALVLPAAGGLKIPVLVYMLVINLMAVSAILASSHNRFFIVGALLFVCSDGFIAVNKFVMAVPLGDYWVMLTYYLAQYYLATASFAQGQHAART
jgi:uncharacterized membrane protein YhhN